MRDLYSDDYESVAGDGADRLIPEGIRRLAGAAVFVGLVAAMGLWSYRLGTRDAGEVPIIRAMEGPTRVAAGGSRRAAGRAPGPRGQRRARRRAGAVPRSDRRAAPAPPALAAEDAPQGELVLAAPAVLAERGARRGRRPADAAAGGRRRTARAGDVGRRQPEPASAARPELGEDGDRRAGRRAGRGRATGPPTWWSPAPKPGRSSPPAAPVRGEGPPAAEPTRRRRAGRAPAPRGGLGRAAGHRGSSSSAPSTARRSPARPGRSWWRGTATCSASKSLYVERTTANARVFYRLRVAGFADLGRDAADVRGAAGARHRLHPGDAAVDGRPRGHLRLRRARARPAAERALLRRGRSLGLHPLRPQRREPRRSCAG